MKGSASWRTAFSPCCLKECEFYQVFSSAGRPPINLFAIVLVHMLFKYLFVAASFTSFLVSALPLQGEGEHSKSNLHVLSSRAVTLFASHEDYNPKALLAFVDAIDSNKLDVLREKVETIVSMDKKLNLAKKGERQKSGFRLVMQEMVQDRKYHNLQILINGSRKEKTAVAGILAPSDGTLSGNEVKAALLYSISNPKDHQGNDVMYIVTRPNGFLVYTPSRP
ncbi:hypothetical protein H0H93_001411 [Arthromyces matolae]|nr:hypothetical protein H0H93_001411 [Arthromyces matolae]